MAYNRWPSSYGSYEPLTYVRGYPVDLTTLITAIHVAATIVCAFALAAGFREAWSDTFIFSTARFWDGKMWTLATDPFFHDISAEHIWLALNLFFFFQFGRELERLIGRKSFGLLYASLVLVPALACLAAAPLLGMSLQARVPYVLVPAHFAIFVGYALVFPGVSFLGGISAKWLAIVLIAINTLSILALPNFPALIPFAVSLGTAYLFLRLIGAGRELGLLEVWHSWREKRHDQKIQKRKQVQKQAKQEVEASVDAILDKINLHGIHSLTAKERSFLENKGTQLRAGEGKGR